MSNNSLPNFFIGGVNNGGTSFLYSVLKQHPEIYLPREMRPEPSFFYKSWEYKKGMDYYCTRWFSAVPKSAIAIGEKSANYLFGGAKVAERIYKELPKVKLIFILRNPIERAWANYRFTVLEGLENLPFEEALRMENQRVREESGIWAEIQPRSYIGRGFYAQKLKEFLSYFHRSQLLIIKSESFFSDTDDELRKIYKFLGVTDIEFRAQTPPTHTSLSIIDPAVQMDLRNYFGDRFDTIVEATRKELELTQFIQNREDIDAIHRLQSNMKGRKEKIPVSARAYLSDIFVDDMNELQSIVDFDISDWK
jgi:Sulfotransferase domain